MSDIGEVSDTELSPDTLSALQEFYTSQQEKEGKLQEFLQTKGQQTENDINLDENWQLSQFWYDNETADILAREACRVAEPNGKIALISCPTLYTRIKKLSPLCEVKLLEYDKRFAVHGTDFVFYNYEAPLDVPTELASYFDIVLLDPPFLSDECLTKSAVTARFLAKDKLILCTGAVMEDLAKRLLDMRKSGFEPRHQNNLCNEFSCYANYDIDVNLL